MLNTRRLMAILLLMPTVAFPTGSITGKILGEQSQPLAFATVAIHETDSSLVDGTITGADGTFLIEKLKPGEYYLEARFVGYQIKIISGLTINNSTKSLSVGEIQLVVDDRVLKGIEIEADRFFVENRVDRKVVQINQNLTSVSGNLGNTLKDLASFSVDASGTISFRGSQNYKVLIDGKPSALSGPDALKSIPAAYVEEIEILTNPSARYISDSEAGVINVIMKKVYKNGISGHAGMHYDYRDEGNYGERLQGNFHLKKERIRFYIQGSLNVDSIQLDGYTDIITTDDNYYFIRQRNARQLRRAADINVQSGIDMPMNDNHTLSIWSAFSRGKSDYQALADDFDRESGSPDYWGTLKYRNKRKNNEWQATMDDQIKFGRSQLQFLTDFAVSDNRRDNFREYFTSDSVFSGKLERIDSTFFDQYENRNRWHSEINYTLNLSDSSRLEMGLLHELYNRTNFFKEFYFNELKKNTTAEYRMYIWNAYLLLASRWMNIDYHLGARVEYSARTLGGFQETRLFTVFPSIHLKKSYPSGLDITLSYSKRIRRPSVYELSPVFLYADNQVTWMGNPELTDAMVHALEWQVIRGIGSASISTSLFYRYISNSWFRYLKANGSDTFINYPYQVNREVNLGIEAMANIELIKKLSIKAGATLFHQEIDNKERTPDATNVSSRYNLAINYKPAQSWSLQISGLYKGPQLASNSITAESYLINAIAQKNFFGNRLKLSLSALDIFSTDIYQQRYREVNGSSGYMLKEYFNSNSRYFTITLNYSFSNFNEKHLRKNIQVND